MDVGIFKTSSIRLKLWLMIPPLLIVSIGLGSYAWRQRAQWKLLETEALTEMLPDVISARRNAMQLFDGLKITSSSDMASDDQLISFLQDMGPETHFMLDTVNMIERSKHMLAKQSLNAVVRGRGDFTAIQMYINSSKSDQQLLSVDSLRVETPEERNDDGMYDVEIVFEYLMLDELKTTNGGV